MCIDKTKHINSYFLGLQLYWIYSFKRSSKGCPKTANTHSTIFYKLCSKDILVNFYHKFHSGVVNLRPSGTFSEPEHFIKNPKLSNTFCFPLI